MGMFDNGFDAIVIGAGHNGMALAAYLAKSGWSVAVLERRTEEGGGLSTEEVTEPNFLHNLHSNYHSLVGLSPAYDDLELFDNGVDYAHPDVQMGSIFSVITVREGLARDDYKDPGWYRHPAGTVAHQVNGSAPEAPRRSGAASPTRDEIEVTVVKPDMNSHNGQH